MFGKPLGVQLLAELWDCRADIDDPKQIEQVLLEAAHRCGAEVIGHMFHEFEPQGVSGVVVISESHLTVHTWPELSYAAIDIFTCGEHVDPWVALQYVAQQFKTDEIHATEINRGMKVKKRRNG